MAEIDALLRIMTERGSSDLHVKVGNSPAIRLNGKLVILRDLPVLNADQTHALAVGMMNDAQRDAFEHSCEADFAYSVSGVGRFRVNAFHQRGSVGLTLRRVGLCCASSATRLPPRKVCPSRRLRRTHPCVGTCRSADPSALSAIAAPARPDDG